MKFRVNEIFLVQAELVIRNYLFGRRDKAIICHSNKAEGRINF